MEKRQIEPRELLVKPMELIGKDWLLLSAHSNGRSNAMTCSWGGLGVLWNKNVVFVFVRHSRYTYSLIEEAESFSLSWLDDPSHKLLGYMGRVSGRDEDKIATSGLAEELREGVPCYEQAKLTLVCRKLYAQDIDPEQFVDKGIVDACYGDGDYHRMYVGEIILAEEAV